MDTLRYYQIRFDVTRDFNLGAFEGAPEGPLPNKVTCRAICTPDVGTYICSAQRMIYIEPLDYDAEWTGEAGAAFAALPEEDRESLRDWWYNELCGVDTDPDYYSYRSFVSDYSKDGPVTWKCDAHFQGTYETDDGPVAPDDAREDAQGNHHV